MPDPRIKPFSAIDTSASDEASKLELYLQRQLEEDVARIFDESIYSDLEVVCGKLKVLTHSCILKARTNKFYSKLEAILHVNIGRETFDEIYSFISDAYTECDIKNQEKEILIFLKSIILPKSSLPDSNKKKEGPDDIDVFLTPKCISPYMDNKYQHISSPSTELTKEYYALVHIEGNLLEQELIEQDALSNAFHTIIKSQDRESKVLQRNKPTSLSLISNHSSKAIDNYNKIPNENVTSKDCEKITNHNQCTKTTRPYKGFENNLNNTSPNEALPDKILDSTFSPDSLITDEPSSSSDYLSADYTCSPALGSSACLPQFSIGENSTKMENIFNSSDSGLTNTGMLESLNSIKDVTLTDISFTESAHYSTAEKFKHVQKSTSSPESDCNQTVGTPIAHSGNSSLNSRAEFNRSKSVNELKQVDFTYCMSSKEEKQRQNEEIVVLESSSVSSETGSWESVFPPKLTDKEICDTFIQAERQYVTQDESNIETPNEHMIKRNIFMQSTPCFIDAANLADEDQLSVQPQNIDHTVNMRIKSNSIPAPSKPIPCCTVNKSDVSPGDWSENNDNDDSLEQGVNKDTNSVQKDLTLTIFEFQDLAEEMLYKSIIPENKDVVAARITSNYESVKTIPVSSSTVYMSTTPHNSITSLKACSLKKNVSHDDINDAGVKAETVSNVRQRSTSIEHVNTSNIELKNNSLFVSRTDKTPVVAGVADNNTEVSKPVYVSAWVVDMSTNSKEPELSKSTSNFDGKNYSDNINENVMNIPKVLNMDSSKNKSFGDSSDKSGQKFYIDLSTLPDPLPPEKPATLDHSTEKKNIFSMYIDVGENATLKEMPSRLANPHHSKKPITEYKCAPKPKTPKPGCNENNMMYVKPQDDMNMTFEKYEILCEDPTISVYEIIATTEPRIYRKSNESPEAQNSKVESTVCLLNGDQNLKAKTTDLFVKLSDLDKPTQKSDFFDRESLDIRMTRSIPENNWPDQNVQTRSSRSSEVISSFHSENAQSLNRLFPHLKNEFSKSMPISLSGRTRSPLRAGVSSSSVEIDKQVSDVSEISSMQSSMCRSVIENSTTEDTSQTSSLIGNCQSRLGQDLLRMFLEEIAPDVIVEVSGKRIKAHKCILSSRCQYFAGILSGGWVESAGNVIVLPPFSFNVVHFALCHIYSGLSSIPDSISIVELATIADMLGLEGLKEAIMFTLKTKYCHHFHRPCQVCTAGVLECFPLSSVYGLDDLYRKCLRWITKYFSKVWPTKAFATLPKELLDKCYQEHIVNLTIENLIDTVYGCGITVASLQNSRWAEIVARLCRRLVNAAAHFAAPRLLAILEIFSSASDAPQAAKQALDDCLAVAIEWAPPDETCRAYAFLSGLIKEIRNHHLSKPDLITNGNQIAKSGELKSFLFSHASSWLLQCEGALVRAAPRVVGTQAFKDLPPDLRRRLRDLGCIMYGPIGLPIATSSPLDKKAKSAYHSKPIKPIIPSTTRSLDMDKMRTSFVPYKPKPVVTVILKEKIKSNSELRDITDRQTDKRMNKATVPKVRTTKAQEERAKFNQTKKVTTQGRIVNKTASARLHQFENTKPRYLEPRVCKDKEKKLPPKKVLNKEISSSESSRISSPILTRNLRLSRMTSTQNRDNKAHAMSQDSLATTSRPRTAEPSTDSLSESQKSNKYGTYTKTKHTSNESVESGISKCQGLSPSSLLNATVKTKIPVYLNQTYATSTNKQTTSSGKVQGNTQAKNKGKTKSCDRGISGSLMNATKSSSAKIVPRMTKEFQMSHSSQRPCKQTKTSTKHANKREHTLRDNLPTIERSGTFLKDEPTFCDKIL